MECVEKNSSSAQLKGHSCRDFFIQITNTISGLTNVCNCKWLLISSASFPLSPPAEQQVKISASKRWREHNEERRNVYENYAEEVHDGKEGTANKGSWTSHVKKGTWTERLRFHSAWIWGHSRTLERVHLWFTQSCLPPLRLSVCCDRPAMSFSTQGNANHKDLIGFSINKKGVVRASELYLSHWMIRFCKCWFSLIAALVRILEVHSGLFCSCPDVRTNHQWMKNQSSEQLSKLIPHSEKGLSHWLCVGRQLWNYTIRALICVYIITPSPMSNDLYLQSRTSGPGRGTSRSESFTTMACILASTGSTERTLRHALIHTSAADWFSVLTP